MGKSHLVSCGFFISVPCEYIAFLLSAEACTLTTEYNLFPNKRKIKKGGENMIVQNTDFMCELCGRLDMVASTVILEANYGSDNDGERVKLNVCGCCFDKLFEVVKNKA